MRKFSELKTNFTQKQEYGDPTKWEMFWCRVWGHYPETAGPRGEGHFCGRCRTPLKVDLPPSPNRKEETKI